MAPSFPATLAAPVVLSVTIPFPVGTGEASQGCSGLGSGQGAGEADLRWGGERLW